MAAEDALAVMILMILSSILLFIFGVASIILFNFMKEKRKPYAPMYLAGGVLMILFSIVIPVVYFIGSQTL